MKNLFSHQTPLEELTMANESIGNSLASLYSNIGSSANFVKSKLGSLASSISSAFAASTIIELPELVGLDKESKTFVENINKVPYSEYREIKAFKPEGLCVSYLEFMDVLDKAVDHLESLEGTLNKYYVYLGLFCSDKNMRMETNTGESVYKQMEQKRNSLYKSFGSCYKHDSVESITTVKEVVARHGDWSILFKRLAQLSVNIKSFKIVDLNKKIKECESLIDIIISKIDNKELEDVSPESIKCLSNGAYQTAKEMELFSTTYYRILTLEGSVDNTLKQLSKIYK